MGKQEKKCSPVELLDANGNFNTDAMKKFEEDAKLQEQGRCGGVVSIMGPQSSGKSTLGNNLFSTNFMVMDAEKGRYQTTKGVWLARTESSLLVLDTEGSDSAERKDNTTFERQIALFAIAVSDIVIINMWHQDVGRRNAASWPLLTIVFEVMPRILKPRKVHLIFVLRDHMETPLEKLKTQLLEQLKEIWKEIPKPRAHKNTALGDWFEIEVVALPSYKLQKQQFDEEVTILRKRVVRSLASSELTTNKTNASAFTLKTKMIWDQIKENKDLDLPSLMVGLAKKRCNKISEEKYQNFLRDTSWIKVKSNVDSGTVVQGFGKTVSPLIDTYLSEYDLETEYFDEGVRAAKRKLLEEKMLLDIERTYQSLLERMGVNTMENFAKAIAEGLHKKRNKKERLEKIVEYQTNYLISEMLDQFEDAAIIQANWNHATTELERLSTQMHAYVEHIRPIIEKKGDEGVLEALQIGLAIASLGVTVMTGIPLFIGG